MDFVIAGLAAVCAGIFTNPLELLKIRMQLQGELRKKGEHAIYYKNILQAGYIVAKHDGVLALQRGLVPALWVQLIMNGLRLGTYEQARSRGFITDAKGNIVFSKHILVGGCCGMLGQFTTSPLYMIKTQLQARAAANIAVGYQHHHVGTWMALKNIFQKYGVKGLYRGALASMPRAFIASTSQLTAFTYSKEKLVQYNILHTSPYIKSFIASMIGGVVISVMVAPFDLVLIRLYNQGVSKQGDGLLYKGYLDCVLKIYKLEGLLGFYKGLGTIYVRLGPHTVLCLMFWDLFKDLYHRYFANL